MNNALVSNWNKVVAPNDIVFHLGDFCFGDRKTWPGQWNGAVHCFGHSHTSPYNQNQADYDYIQHSALPSYDVGVDNNNFTPISYDELKTIFTKQLLYGHH